MNSGFLSWSSWCVSAWRLHDPQSVAIYAITLTLWNQSDYNIDKLQILVFFTKIQIDKNRFEGFYFQTHFLLS